MPCWFLSVTKIGHLKVAALLQKRSVGMIFAQWQICQGTLAVDRNVVSRH